MSEELDLFKLNKDKINERENLIIVEKYIQKVKLRIEKTYKSELCYDVV